MVTLPSESVAGCQDLIHRCIEDSWARIRVNCDDDDEKDCDLICSIPAFVTEE